MASSGKPEVRITSTSRAAESFLPCSTAWSANRAFMESSAAGNAARRRRTVPAVRRGSSNSRTRAVNRLQKHSSSSNFCQRRKARLQSCSMFFRSSPVTSFDRTWLSH